MYMYSRLWTNESFLRDLVTASPCPSLSMLCQQVQRASLPCRGQTLAVSTALPTQLDATTENTKSLRSDTCTETFSSY